MEGADNTYRYIQTERIAVRQSHEPLFFLVEMERATASHPGRMAEALNSSGRPIAAGQSFQGGQERSRGDRMCMGIYCLHGYIILTIIQMMKKQDETQMCFSW